MHNGPDDTRRPEDSQTGSPTDDLLRGLAVALNTQLARLRRVSDQLAPEELRRELALAAAMMDTTRETVGEDAIAAQMDKARGLVEPRRIIEVDAGEGYRLWSHSYDDELNPVIILEERSLAPMLGDVSGKRVLDVGCGTGRWALRLAAQGARVTAADPCREMLDRGRTAAERDQLQVEWVEAGFGELPREAQYDLVLCNLVLCHIADIDAPIAEMAACLAPGGTLIISDFHFLCQVIGWRTAFTHAGDKYHIENYIHDYGEYVRAFRAAGLTITAIDDIVIDQTLAERGEVDDTLYRTSSKWSGYPICMVIAGEKAG